MNVSPGYGSTLTRTSWPFAQRRDLALGDLTAELERVVLHDPEDDDAGPDVAPRVDETGRDRSGERARISV
jgi:hypothetical protein